MTEEIALHLENHGVRATAVRILVWRTLAKLDFAFALSDLEALLPSVDRSTIFRALTLFADKEMLHVIDDGSGQKNIAYVRNMAHALKKIAATTKVTNHIITTMIASMCT